MNAATIFTRRRMGMDYRVWIVMVVTCFLTLGLFAFKHINKKACAPATITINGIGNGSAVIYNTNRLLLFKIHTDTTANVIWSFGDGTGKFKGQIVSHRFTKEGDYKVKATVNNSCEFEEVITVKEPLILNDVEGPAIEIMEYPKRAKTGNKISFYSIADVKDTAWEWKVLNASFSVQNDSVASFVFSKPGPYIIQLVINNNPNNKITKRIEVVDDKPQLPDIFNGGGGNPEGGSNGGSPNVGPPPVLLNPGEGQPSRTPQVPANGAGQPNQEPLKTAPAAKAIAIEQETFKDMLQEVIDGNKELEEMFTYLDYKETTKVKVNGAKPPVGIKKFVQDMAGNKNRKMEALDFKKDDHNSIQIIKVKVSEKKRGFLKRLLHGN